MISPQNPRLNDNQLEKTQTVQSDDKRDIDGT